MSSFLEIKIDPSPSYSVSVMPPLPQVPHNCSQIMYDNGCPINYSYSVDVLLESFERLPPLLPRLNSTRCSLISCTFFVRVTVSFVLP